MNARMNVIKKGKNVQQLRYVIRKNMHPSNKIGRQHWACVYFDKLD